MMKDEIIKGLQQQMQPTQDEKKALKEALTNSNEEDVIDGIDFLDLKDAITSVAEEEGMTFDEAKAMFMKVYGDSLRIHSMNKKGKKAKRKSKKKQANKSKRKNR
jgi:hypothetical protein